MAGLREARAEIDGRGARTVVIASGRPDAIGEFRSVTGFDGTILVDPSLAAFDAAGLTRSFARMLDPRALPRLRAAMAAGARYGRINGSVLQQGGMFVLGPGERVHFEWRDRFSGDHAPLDRVVAAIPRMRTSPLREGGPA